VHKTPENAHPYTEVKDMIFPGYVGIAGLLTATLVMLWLVPRHQIGRLFPLGVVAGFVVAIFLLIIMQNVLHLWSFYRVDIFTIGGVPLALAATWIPLMITFAGLQLNATHRWQRIVYIFLFPLLATVANGLLVWNQMLVYNNWTSPATYGISLVIHSATAAYVLNVGKASRRHLRT
jgi:hypothetical protein